MNSNSLLRHSSSKTMAAEKRRQIEKIRFKENLLFWTERLPMFFLIFFLEQSLYLSFPFLVFLLSNFLYAHYSEERRLIAPYVREADDPMFYVERVAMLMVAIFYLGGSIYFGVVAVFLFATSNMHYLVQLIGPKQEEIVQINSDQTSTTTLGPNPTETSMDDNLEKEKAENEEEPPKGKAKLNEESLETSSCTRSAETEENNIGGFLEKLETESDGLKKKPKREENAQNNEKMKEDQELEEEKDEIMQRLKPEVCASIDSFKMPQEIHLMWEDDKKNQITQFEVANNSLIQKMQDRQKDLEEQCSKWHEENKDLSAKLDAAMKALESYQCTESCLRNALCSREEQVNKLNASLSAATSWHQHYWRLANDFLEHNHMLMEEKNHLTAKLNTATSSAEYYQTCHNDSEETCHKLREENEKLSAKLSAASSAADYYHDLMHEFENKCQRLEEEKTNLTANLAAAKVTNELYRSYLHEFCD